jgi:di/tricarboxylate transporter
MSVQIISIFVLLAMFVVSAILPINLGVMGFVASFIVGGLIGGMDTKGIFAVFPADMFVTLAGVTYLFAIAQKNGTIDLITKFGLKLVRGNRGLMPWVMFFLAALITSVGSLPPATVAIFAPIALRFAYQYSINPLLMGVMVVNGSLAGYYSPLNPLGLIVNGMMAKINIPLSAGLLFLNNIVFAVVVAILCFIGLGGLRIFKEPFNAEIIKGTEEIAAANSMEKEGINFYRAMTIIGIVLLVISALVFKYHIGLAAFVIGLALNLIAPKQQEGLLKLMPWSVILMISGIVTFVGVLEKIGTVKYIAELLSQVQNPVIATLVASYVGGILSSFASTTGMLAVVIPLVGPILKNPAVTVIGVVSAISIAAAVVDFSPFSTNGALILANAKGVDERKFFRQMLYLSGLFILLGPGLAWLIFVLLGVA